MDIIPAYTTITIVYNETSNHRESITYQQIKQDVKNILERTESITDQAKRTVHIPVCYDTCFSLDGEQLAGSKNMTLEALVEIHASRSYHVYMLGFLPGFAYMGSVDASIAAPRLAAPRGHVPSGSVGIAGEQTGIYPLCSPGGWNIIGRTPLKLFDPEKSDPVLLHPGDIVTFIPISKVTFDNFDSLCFSIFADEHTYR